MWDDTVTQGFCWNCCGRSYSGGAPQWPPLSLYSSSDSNCLVLPQKLFFWEDCKQFSILHFGALKYVGKDFHYGSPVGWASVFIVNLLQLRKPLDLCSNPLGFISLISSPDTRSHAKSWWPLVPLGNSSIINIIRIMQNCLMSLLSEVYQQRGKKLLYLWRQVWKVGKSMVWFSFWNLPNFLKGGGDWTSQTLCNGSFILTFPGQICITEERKS